MLPSKRLQVFISSTYKDLVEERQAAVEAILASGHIPAGMELFSAGDQSQMQVIKDWINQSDVYLLILGGCYGSIEPISGKSYTQIEYEYALSLNKPLFSIVITPEYLEEKVRKSGSTVLETKHPNEYEEFKELVLSRMVRFWSDKKDIKLSIFETMSEFSNRNELTGWVSGNQKVDTTKLVEELTQLTKENNKLATENSLLQKNQKGPAYKNLNAKRRGFTQKAQVAGIDIVISASEYKDGTLGEFFIEIAKESATLRSILSEFAASVSIGLQWGIPLDDYVERFVYTKFEPAGMVNHPNIKVCTSILDYIFRLLAFEYLGRTDLIHILETPEIDE